MAKSVEQIAEESGTSVWAVCRTLIKLIERGHAKCANGSPDDALADLRQRMAAELSR